MISLDAPPTQATRRALEIDVRVEPRRIAAPRRVRHAAVRRTDVFYAVFVLGILAITSRVPARGTGVDGEATGRIDPSVAPALSFEEVTIDPNVAIGYGLAVGDVDGDGRVDILLADKKEYVWYHNPDWKRHVLWANPKQLDNVCIAARDIDGDGKVEIAVGAEWNPGDTRDSGSVHYLVRPADPTSPWGVVDLHREPTVHRMQWVRAEDGTSRLVVAPLHGRGNVGGRGEGVRVLSYEKPSDPRAEWPLELVDGGMHILHNLDPVAWDEDPAEEILIGGTEGVFLCDRGPSRWTVVQIAGNAQGETAFRGASEVRLGRGPGVTRYVATIEPFHGTLLTIHLPRPDRPHALWARRVLDDGLSEGHAIACGDLDADGIDELVVGWRGVQGETGRVGVKIFDPNPSLGGSPLDGPWGELLLDDGGMACEDARIADLDGDGRLDVVAAGRATRNLKIYWNRGTRR
jgi:hypothetical protein